MERSIVKHQYNKTREKQLSPEQGNQKSIRGIASEYADPARKSLERQAFSDAMIEKHGEKYSLSTVR